MSTTANDAGTPAIQPPHLLFSAAPSLQRRKVFITNPSRTERLVFRVRTNAPDRVSVDTAAGTIHPRSTVAVRVFWSGGDDGSAAATASSSPPVVVVTSTSRPVHSDDDELLLGTPLPDVVLPVVALPRLADAENAASRLRAATRAAGGPAAAAALVRAFVDVLYCEGVVGAEGAVLAAGAAALSVAADDADAAVAVKKAPSSTSSWFKPRPATPAAATPSPGESPPPAPLTPGASPPPDAAAAGLPPAPAATADDVADELIDCLDRLRGAMHAADAGLPLPARGSGGGGGGGGGEGSRGGEVTQKIRLFESLFAYGGDTS